MFIDLKKKINKGASHILPTWMDEKNFPQEASGCSFYREGNDSHRPYGDLESIVFQ